MKNLRAPLAAIGALAIAMPAFAQDRLYGPNPDHPRGNGGPVVMGCVNLGGQEAAFSIIPNTLIEISPGNNVQAVSVVPLHLIGRGGRVDMTQYNQLVTSSGFDRAATSGQIAFMAPYSSGVMLHNGYPQPFPAPGEDLDGIYHTPEGDMAEVFVPKLVRERAWSNEGFVETSAVALCSPGGRERVLRGSTGGNRYAPVIRGGPGG